MRILFIKRFILSKYIIKGGWNIDLDKQHLKDLCLDELYDEFKKWNEEDLRKAQINLNMPQVGWWNKVLSWALIPTEYYSENGEKGYHFKSKKNNVYCSFSRVQAASGSGYHGPNLNFYIKRKGTYERIDEIGKYCVDAEIRDLIEEKEKKNPKKSFSWSG